MTNYQQNTYGEEIAEVYDQLYSDFDPACIDFLAELAGPGPAGQRDEPDAVVGQGRQRELLLGVARSDPVGRAPAHANERRLAGSVGRQDRLGAVAQDEVLVRDGFDHRDLNDDTELFRDLPPTAENVSRVIFDLLDAALPEGALQRVCLRPVPDLAVEVRR